MTGWVAIQGHLVGSLQKWSTCWDWNGGYCTSREAAISLGFSYFGSDNFNVAQIRDGELIWVGWMAEPHVLAEYAELAETFGWTFA